MNIRKLKANEIECRVGMAKQNGYSLLLYKDARCDMSILDELFGWDGWQRTHEFKDGKLYCTIKLWSERLQQWIVKEDVGTESNTEKEKGQASDSFKRACVNLGIGRELYTAPFIWITDGDPKKDKWKVEEIEYNENGEISKLHLKEQKSQRIWTYCEGNRKRANKKESAELSWKTYDEKIDRFSELIGKSKLDCEKAVLSKFNFSNRAKVTSQSIIDGYLVKQLQCWIEVCENRDANKEQKKGNKDNE